MRVGWRLLGESNTEQEWQCKEIYGGRAGGEEGKMEVLFGKRLEGMEECQLVKMVVEKLRED